MRELYTRANCQLVVTGCDLGCRLFVINFNIVEVNTELLYTEPNRSSSYYKRTYGELHRRRWDELSDSDKGKFIALYVHPFQLATDSSRLFHVGMFFLDCLKHEIVDPRQHWTCIFMHFISFFVYYHSLDSTSLFWRFVVIRTNPFFRLIQTLHIELENYFRFNYDSSYRGAYSPHLPFGPAWWSLYNSTDEKCHILDIHDGLVHIPFSTSIFGNPLLIDSLLILMVLT